ncbi:MAG: hypothetical protein NTV51_08375 [Verrucomicrobia bacterium]|nr:hypothetical protein [Verrucomicrobiota bacterium]
MRPNFHPQLTNAAAGGVDPNSTPVAYGSFRHLNGIYRESRFDGYKTMTPGVDNKNHLQFWVMSLREETPGGEFAANGFSLVGDLGFGQSPEGYPLRYYDGSIILIDGCGRTERCDGQISLRHSTRRGFDWVIRSKSFPRDWQPPFLLTNRFETRVGFQGELAIQLNDFGQTFCGDTWSEPFPAITSDGAVVAVIESGNVVGSKLRGKATAFSFNRAASGISGLSFCHDQDQPAFGFVV